MVDLLVFMAGIRHLVRRAREDYDWVAALFFGVGLVVIAVELVADGLQAGAALDTSVISDPTAVRALNEGSSRCTGPAQKMWPMNQNANTRKAKKATKQPTNTSTTRGEPLAAPRKPHHELVSTCGGKRRGARTQFYMLREMTEMERILKTYEDQSTAAPIGGPWLARYKGDGLEGSMRAVARYNSPLSRSCSSIWWELGQYRTAGESSIAS